MALLNPNKIVRYGTDSSGRPIYMTRYMRAWWKRVIKQCGFVPTIVQGAWMTRAGGGADESAGYHDGGGCLDIRTWDRTGDELRKMNRVIRSLGAGGWIRDDRHGMEPHYHLVLGSDFGLSAGAASQWKQYLAGGNGLADRLRDYMWRPNPMVLKPPVEPNTRPLRVAINRANRKAKSLGFDNISERLIRVRESVKAK